MKTQKALTILLALVVVGGVLWVAKAWTGKQPDPKYVKFNTDAENLILGIQQFKEFTGVYPTGNNVQITKALLGRTDKRVMILAARRPDMNDKGEILDPWGTPLQFYFSNNEVMIRSAGPNKAWEDSATPTTDDLFRCAGIDKR
jgi:hypothetical protein